MRKIWQALWNRRRFEDEMAAEMRFHLEARAADLERSGRSKQEAMRIARLEMGAAEAHKEECRRARGLQWFDELRLDLHYALRGLRRNKAFASVAIATLTLGIGANAAIFALVNSVWLKRLPVTSPEQLQAVYWTLPMGKQSFHRSSSGRRMREGALGVSDMFAYRHFTSLRSAVYPRADLFGHMSLGRINVSRAGEAQLVHGIAASWNYFRALGVAPQLGRVFVPEDENEAAEPVVLLSHSYWARSFAADPSVIGQPLGIGDRRATIAGVLPPGFQGINPGEPLDVVVTLTAWDRISSANSLGEPRRWWVKMMARIERGFAPAQFQAEIETRLSALLRATPVPEPYEVPKIRLIEGARGLHWLRSDFERPLRLVMAVALLILLMAAVNTGGLMLARSEARTAETGARLALGASRWRIARQHLTESLLIAFLGLAGGLLLAAILGGALPSLLPSGGRTPVLDLAPDARFAGIAVAVTAAIALLFGLYPAWKSSTLQLTAAMKRTRGARLGRLPMGRLLVATQIGLSVVLLIGAATFVRTVLNLRSVTLGFIPERLLVFSADPSLAGHRGGQIIQFYERAMARLASVPGVRSASMSRHGLLQPAHSSSGAYYRDANGRYRALGSTLRHNIAPGYFDTVGIPLLAGREVRSTDTAKAPRIAVVNRKIARTIRPDGGSPIGLTLYENDKGQEPMEIVGVAGDAKYDSIRADPPATVYQPYAQTAIRGATFFVKTNGDPMSFAAAVREAMKEVDPRVPLYDLRTQEEQIGVAMERETILTKLLAGFGSLALLLAVIGVYGVLAYSVARRTPEIGIRSALGATPGVLRMMVVSESFWPVALGAAGGLYAAWWFTGLLKGFLFEVEPMDAPSVAAAVGVLILAALIAALIPAHRASTVPPSTALRCE